MNLERELHLEKLPILHGQVLERDITPVSDNILRIHSNHIETEDMNRSAIIVSGPPGSGKDTLVSQMLARSDAFGWPKTVTTRTVRESEIGNDPYIRMSIQEFLEAKDAGEFMETDYHGSWYGSPKVELERIYSEGKTPILRIDPNGAESLINLAKSRTSPFETTQIIYAYVVPTNGYELYQRLMRRTLNDNGNDYDEALHKTQSRIKTAVMPDLTHMGNAHFILVNKHNNLDQLTEEFLELIVTKMQAIPSLDTV